MGLHDPSIPKINFSFVMRFVIPLTALKQLIKVQP